MFCQSCGTKLLDKAKFCHNCGFCALSDVEIGSKPLSKTIGVKPLSFEEFRKKKEEDRSSKFKPKPGGKKAKLSKEVKVQVGIVKDKNGDGVLVRVKSRTIIIAVDEDVDGNALLEKAIDKHSRHHKQFNKYNKYVLLYNDMSIVRYLPQTNIPFVLSKYKEDLLLPYSKMYFWLFTEDDFENSISDESSDKGLEEISMKYHESQPSTSKSLATTGCGDFNEDASNKILQSSSLSSQSSFTSTSQVCSMSQGQLSQHGIEKYLLQHQCPTCLGYYSRADIEAHADMCAERWIDPIGKLSDDDQNNLENTLIAEEEIGQPTVATMQEVVHLIQDNVNRLSTNRVTIRRRLSFADYVDARKRKWFAEGGNLKICFAGEPSIDGGGPRREFFTDVLQHIKSTLFDANGYPLFSARALANEDFMVAGELISSSLAQGGPAPCFLAKNVFNYVAEGVNSIQANNWLELVHDANFKDEIDKLVKCESDEELRTLLCSDDMMNILQSIGYRGVPSKEKLASRDNIIRSIVIAGIGHMLAMMDQLKTGLTLFGVLQQIQHHREIMASMLTLDGVANFCLTADIVLENMTVEFSPEGSNKKQLEINVHKFFCDYIQELDTKDTSTSLKTLYRFITGSHSVTLLGAEKHITVKFKHGCPANCKCRPTAATCDPSICFPIHFDNTNDFDLAMDNALLEYSGFGFI